MARQKIDLVQGQVFTTPVLTRRSDVLCVSGVCRYLPAEADDDANTYPEDFLGIPLQDNRALQAVLAGEQIHIKCRSEKATIEIYENGA